MSPLAQFRGSPVADEDKHCPRELGDGVGGEGPVGPFAVYVHIPFCPTKCGYCDFNSYAMEGEIMDRTTQAIIKEIKRSPTRGRPAKTVFFGGGTPTFIPERQLVAILEAVFEAHPPIEDAEITSEANPGTVDTTKFNTMRQAGFNRISLGAQSFLDSDLLTLGRIHRQGEIEKAVAAARQAGFDNLNLDLMFALPGQSVHAWRNNIDRALALQPEHLSLYCLTIEPNTQFYKQRLKGSLDLPDDDQQVAMYDECLAKTAAAGYRQYEISNFARSGFECRHNLEYWECREYAAYGPGAVGMVDQWGVKTRYRNLLHPDRFVAAIEAREPVAFESETLGPEELRTERIMLGLRLNQGFDVADLDLPQSRVEKLRNRGWIETIENRIRLTHSGRHFCSEVALELI